MRTFGHVTATSTTATSSDPAELGVGDTGDERALCAAAWALARGGHLTDLSRAERELIEDTAPLPQPDALKGLAAAIRAGDDPLGALFASLRSAAQRRLRGATYTPAGVVEPMTEWLANHKGAARVVDPGSGSGRFLCAVGRRMLDARLVAVEIDPLPALITRANLTVLGFDKRAELHIGDYRELKLPIAPGPTAFIGNPPYVRHHDIDPVWKAWLRDRAADMNLKASARAGLHVHFLLATAHLARPGDFGVFVTSSEWLDVGYGQLVRDLVAGPLGGLSLHILDAQTQAFADATTTATVTAFEVGGPQRPIRVRRINRVEELRGLAGGESFIPEQLRKERRWSTLQAPRVPVPRDFIALGEFCRVHRGVATGANATWVTSQNDPRLPASVLFPAVTKALELFGMASGVLADSSDLKALVSLPEDLDDLAVADRGLVERFLDTARRAGVADGYIARHRKRWWSVKLPNPAPLLATYMARRPPAFVRNLAAAHNLNNVHGIYPIEPLSEAALCRLTEVLRDRAVLADGRTYAGGLTKFEPSEMARIMVPPPSWLEAGEPWPRSA